MVSTPDDAFEWIRSPDGHAPAVLIFSDRLQAADAARQFQGGAFLPAPPVLVLPDANDLRRDWLASRPDRSCDRNAVQARVVELLRPLDRRTILVVVNTHPEVPLDWIGSVFGQIVLETFIAQDAPLPSVAGVCDRQLRAALAHDLPERLIV